MEQIKVFMVGDSTMTNYEADVAPRAGWGQVFNTYFEPNISILNAASSGRSSKSFIDEKKLEKIASEIGENDYLFIQFGHNDQKTDEERHTEPFTTYKSYLSQYINTAIEKQAIPILITPVQRRSCGVNGKLHDTHGEYPIAMKELAEECNVLLIDLGSKSKSLLENIGPEKSKQLYLWYNPSEEPNYPEGVQDDTHFSLVGAHLIARLIVDELKTMNLSLSSSIKDKW
ncbi:rhamnogalacturonan acetylesterase [Anaerobacillus alkalilacustris]|uniref:Rhamnogalacturonan acetylesterase n=1 Tax=Anaerobacillus alkalilacustris TaxID=393763 RepID=A0A1S2LQA6_9BACI|nr:rhamnogalacturonan acetylesterase [Anaerobacillus alkalilacustris]OIJ14681.1 rhamnogalacturonan acetylesterase [Anaerobacillus alkalilacustris]